MTEQENAQEMRSERYYPSEEFISKSRVKSMQEYRTLYERSINDPEGFWMEMAEDLTWIKKWDRVVDYDFHEARVRWFEGGKLNVSANCLDRHQKTWRKNKAALIWQGEPVDELQVFTYQTLFQEVNKFANVFRKKVFLARVYRDVSLWDGPHIVAEKTRAETRAGAERVVVYLKREIQLLSA
jgi:acetyl-CoA synthetase